jgi:ferredoxin-NADP reductase
MLSELALTVNQWALKSVGREWIDYFASNTMNLGTKRLAPFFWTYDCQAKIVNIRHETHDTMTLELLPNQHFAQAQAGQYIEISVTIDGQKQTRCYSLSHLHRETVAVTIKRKEGGLVSNWLFKHAQRGMCLAISHPQGRFVYQGQDHVLLISAGSGITPCYALLNQLLTEQNTVDVVLMAQFKTTDDVIFSEALSVAATKCSIYLPLTRADIKADVISQLEQYPELLDRDIYLCGPAGFMDKVVAYLESKNYDLSRLAIERFNFDENVDLGEQCLSEIYFQSYNTTVKMNEADKGKTLLEIAEAHGLELEHGCRTGMCGSCKCRLVQGEVTGNKLGVAVYPCTAYPASSKVVIG